ncbi:hypothetical protein GFGA_1c1389 [Gluconobacter frateurii NBRC 103465]|nr:hypothetical protein GFGA_1c1389 [Gluconobacter frateurii NBRC 103465]
MIVALYSGVQESIAVFPAASTMTGILMVSPPCYRPMT